MAVISTVGCEAADIGMTIPVANAVHANISEGQMAEVGVQELASPTRAVWSQQRTRGAGDAARNCIVGVTKRPHHRCRAGLP